MFPTPATDQDAALPAIEAAVAAVIDDDVVAIGIGMAGLVDVRHGRPADDAEPRLARTCRSRSTCGLRSACP